MTTDVIFDEETDKELADYGLTECDCNADAAREDIPCAVCGELTKPDDHVHYKGQYFDLWCLVLALLRELKHRV